MTRVGDENGSTEAVQATGSWSLTDLIDVATLQSIQDTFARAFGIPTVIITSDGRNATEITNRVSFCEDLTRTSPVGGPRCTGCDMEGMHEASLTGSPAIFRCWNGLYDCAIPIAPKGEALGYFLCGQIVTEEPDDDVYRDTAVEIGVAPDDYVTALKDVRIIPYERYEASVQSMHVLAEMIAEQAAAAMDNYQMLESALRAKDDASHLMQELDAILEVFSDIGSQPDYDSTLEAIADNLGRLIPHDSCLIYSVDEEERRLSPMIVRDPYAEVLAEHRPEIGVGIIGKVAQAKSGRLVSDATLDPDSFPIEGVPVEPESMVVVPMVHKGVLSGVISLSRFQRRIFTEHEYRILSVVASTQAAMALENARMQERERVMLEQYRLLADLGASLVSARDEDTVREVMLLRTKEILDADVCFLALRRDLPDEVGIRYLSGRGAEEMTLSLPRNARLAALRLDAERMTDRSVFEAWSGAVKDEFASRFPMAESVAEPLVTAGGVLGGIFVGWADEDAERAAGARRILSVIAGAGGATLYNYATYAQTDSSLRSRVRELQAMTRLAERITSAVHEAPIVDELLNAAIEVGRMEGAAFLVPSAGDWVVKQVSGLGRKQVEELREALLEIELDQPVVRTSDRADGGMVVRMPGEGSGGAVIAGVIREELPLDQDTLLSTLARYGAVAIDNARLHDRQDQAISRLEQSNREAMEQFETLQRLLSVHKSLAAQVLEGNALGSLARSLAQMVGGEVTIVGPGHMPLAAWPREARVPVAVDEGGPESETSTTETEGGTIVTAPVVVEGAVLAWVAARLERNLGQVEQAAIEYGALLTALDLLREKTAIEVETRLRGGVIEELFNESFQEETVLKQSSALGFDLGMRSRVFVLEPVSDEPTRETIESLYGAVSEVARGRKHDALVALRGNSVVVIQHEPEDGDAGIESEILASGKARLPQVPLNLAVGTLCEELSDYRSSYIAARRGLDLLRLLGRSGETFSFRDAGVEHLLLQATEPSLVLGFIDTFVTPLEEYDGGHSSQLCHTLETFYRAGMNLEEGARRLHIHVSTLRYRLGKVEELLGVDVKGRDRLDVELAIRASKVLAPFRDRPSGAASGGSGRR